MCVFVCVCIAETVLCYININKLVFSKSVSQGCCRSCLAISSLDAPLINASVRIMIIMKVLVFYMFYFVKY